MKKSFVYVVLLLNWSIVIQLSYQRLSPCHVLCFFCMFHVCFITILFISKKHLDQQIIIQIIINVVTAKRESSDFNELSLLETINKLVNEQLQSNERVEH